MTRPSRRLLPLLATATATALLLAACGGDDEGDWSSWNEDRTEYDADAVATAEGVIADINDAGIDCGDVTDYPIEPIRESYVAGNLPLPVGASQCTAANEENVLVEVFTDDAPNAEDYVAAKRELLCERAKELGRLPDGTSDFPGIPYLMNAEKTWLVQPDEFETNERIGRALDLESRDMCEGIE